MRAACPKLPILVGSGCTPYNIHSFAAADGFIVGSWLKAGGVWSSELSEQRCREMADAVRAEGASCLGD